MSDATAETAPRQHAWQLEDTGPDAYERYLVPAFFAPCADLVLNAASIMPRSNVLDLACGTGIVARSATNRVGPAGSVVGSDRNAAMLGVAEKVARDAVPEIRWVAADAEALPFTDGSFDVVCCQQGLQFFADRLAALREARRVLAPDGRLVLAIWRPIEHSSVFGPFIEALTDHVGDEAAAIMRSPFSGPPIEDLRSNLRDAGFGRVRATVEPVRVRFPTVDTFVMREVQSSPLVEPVGSLTAKARDKFVRDVRARLAPWVDDAGLGFAMETWVVVADRPVNGAA